jgi:hypothetical protein
MSKWQVANQQIANGGKKMNIKISRKWLVSLGVTLGILILLWVISSALAQGPEPGEGVSAAATLNSRISYQGELKENGTPVTGSRNMTFGLYSNDSCTSLVRNLGTKSVTVADGLFTEYLDVTHSDFNGQGLWLKVTVESTDVDCLEILPAPYALSLRPEAYIERSATGSAVLGVRASLGYALYAETDDGLAVYAHDAGSTQARGYAGYFTSDNGIGVYGYSSATSTTANAYMPGVYGRSASGRGVYGVSDGSKAGVYGESGSGNGVHGKSGGSGDGVYGTSEGGYGVHGEVDGYQTAVYGHNTSTLGGLGVYGENNGNGAGVSGLSSSGPGVHGYSSSGYGVQGVTGATYGFYTPDSLYVAGTCTGGGTCNEDIAEYIDAELDVEPGDVVIAVAPVTVGKSTQPNDTRVVGIISTNPAIVFPGGTDSAETEGNRLPLALAGVAPCKASAENGPIAPGDLLVASATPGHTMRAAPNPPVGTVVGKALEPLDEGTGLIQILVMLQ